MFPIPNFNVNLKNKIAEFEFTKNETGNETVWICEIRVVCLSV
jgi:hypothetical protein